MPLNRLSVTAATDLVIEHLTYRTRSSPSNRLKKTAPDQRDGLRHDLIEI